MKLKSALFSAALALAVSGSALAQGLPGLYVSGAGGVNWLKNAEADTVDSGISGKWKFDTSAVVQFGFGYALGFGPRFEFEGSYRHDDLRTIDSDCCGNVDGRGNVKQFGMMANVAYDFFTGTPFTPYVGVGGGAVRLRIVKGGPHFDPLDFIDDSAWVYGVQGFAGVDYQLLPKLRIGLKYNFLHIGRAEDLFTRLDNFCGAGCTDNTSGFDPNNHSIMVALQYSFGSPPAPPPAPAPVAAAAPALQRNFLVFFDFDKSDITAEADRVIVQAANNAKTAAVTRVTLTGHTDRAGPVAYNQRLSERRADAVKARLIREGVPAGQIVTIGRGEGSPLVNTADGVREPQNRRVEIVL